MKKWYPYPSYHQITSRVCILSQRGTNLIVGCLVITRSEAHNLQARHRLRKSQVWIKPTHQPVAIWFEIWTCLLYWADYARSITNCNVIGSVAIMPTKVCYMRGSRPLGKSSMAADDLFPASVLRCRGLIRIGFDVFGSFGSNKACCLLCSVAHCSKLVTADSICTLSWLSAQACRCWD